MKMYINGNDKTLKAHMYYMIFLFNLLGILPTALPLSRS